MTERVLLAGRVPAELKDLVDADLRDNQEVIEAALWREYENQTKSVIERRIDETKRRISNLESERNARERDLAEERDHLATLESQLQAARTRKESVAQEFVDTVSDGVDLSPESPAIRNWAEKAEMDPADFAELVREVRQ